MTITGLTALRAAKIEEPERSEGIKFVPLVSFSHREFSVSKTKSYKLFHMDFFYLTLTISYQAARYCINDAISMG